MKRRNFKTEKRKSYKIITSEGKINSIPHLHQQNEYPNIYLLYLYDKEIKISQNNLTVND